MNTKLIIALLIPWVFWGFFMGLLIYARRSWINLLLIPVGVTIVLLIVIFAVSVQEAFWLSIISHIVFLVFIVGSMVRLSWAQWKNQQRDD